MKILAFNFRREKELSILPLTLSNYIPLARLNLYTVGLQKTQQFEIRYTRLGTRDVLFEYHQAGVPFC